MSSSKPTVKPHKYKSVFNVELAYHDGGPRGGPPIVFVHAFPMTEAMWRPQREILEARCRVITYDIRGFGGSGAGDGQYTLEIFVDDLIALLDHLKIDKTVVAGLSMGGYIALRAIERNPERFSGLVLADTQSAADSNPAKLKRTATIRAVKTRGVAEFASEFLKSALSSNTRSSNPALVSAIQGIIEANEPLGISGALMALAGRTDTTESLEKINVPTLILVGQDDAITPPPLAEAMRQKIGSAQLQIISHAGHFSNLENPREFNEALLGFLKLVGNAA